MAKTEVLDPEIAEIGRRRFNFPWCTGYKPNKYRNGIDLLIHKNPNDCQPHRLRHMLLFYTEQNIHNEYLGRYVMNQAKELEGIAPEQYGIRKPKAAYAQALNNCPLF